MKIHPLAIVSPQADLGHHVEIGPFSVIEPGVVIGDGCRLETHVVVKEGTTLGADNHVYDGTILGSVPQHIHLPQNVGALRIGPGNTIRENVTMHRSLEEGTYTHVGAHNLFMVNSHVAHNCHVGDQTIFANNTLLAGHVEVHDRAFISGAVAIHQFCRIGTLAMVGGMARVVQDVPPFVTVDGQSGFVVGLNSVGLKRNDFTPADIAQLKDAYRLIYRSGLPWEEMLKRLRGEFSEGPAAEFSGFFSAGTRGFVRARKFPAQATIKLRDDAADGEPPQVLPKAG